MAVLCAEGLSRGSHREVTVLCDWQASPECRRVWTTAWRTAVRDREAGDGSDICLYCSRLLRTSGTGNGNCQYPDLDETYLDEIGTEQKAYLLGWIASDNGNVRDGAIRIGIHRRDEGILRDLRDLLSRSLPIIPVKGGEQVSLMVSRKRIVEAACKHLDIDPNAGTVAFPALEDDRLRWAFLRGLFDGAGSVRDPRRTTTPECSITNSSPRLLDGIAELTADIPHQRRADQIEWQGTCVLDLLGRLYDDAIICMPRKFQIYQDWVTWVPFLGGPGNSRFQRPLFQWLRVHPDAVPPRKARVTDSGYDVTIIGERDGDRGAPTRLYVTGIRVVPLQGWYFDLVPRSSIYKTGYMLANSVGVIDRSYRGEVLVPLIKVVQDAPDLTFPARIVQIIPRPVVHVAFEEVEELDETARGEGGFGSSGTA
jgi:deoxyuridine 5'-triphosphate nucleotidohydrolase